MKATLRLSWLPVAAAVTTVCGVALAYAPADATAPGSSGAARSTPADGSAAGGVVIEDIGTTSDAWQVVPSRLAGPAEIVVVPGATHLFEEPGAMDRVIELALDALRA